jgi:pimeloyl-ACP methyl ester carboxylesterase
MRDLFRPLRQDRIAQTHMVWLPGAFHTPEDFVDAGFGAAVRARGIALDVEFVHLEHAHVGDRRGIAKLAQEIIAPVRARGCPAIWLGGISLGGFFALDYAATQAGEWDGLCLLAPYLGNRLLIAEISSAPSVAAWQPGPLAESDEERRIWRFAQTWPAEPRPLYLGFGRDDRFARAHGLLAQMLPPDAVNVVPGDHDWSDVVDLVGTISGF